MFDAGSALDAAAERIFETMFFTVVLEQGGPAPAAPVYTASLRFSGPANGEVVVSVSRRTASALAANLLGDDGEITAAQAASTVGELANILCGSLAGALDPDGQFVISTPEVSETADAAAAVEAMPVRRVYVLEEGVLAAGVALAGGPA